jgi:ribulose-5-phosphate 4-epimerase/fuculose-1-phosphate aldolase
MIAGAAEARANLAAAHRLAVLDGLAEGTWNHFTHRLADRKMLMTPLGVHWSQVRASSLREWGEDADEARSADWLTWTGYEIHYPLYSARPDITCALHLHPPYVTALASLVGGRVEPVTQHATTLYRRIAYGDEDAEGRPGALRGCALADALGDADILILARHGVLVVGQTVGAAYVDLFMLERACRTQLLAMATGRQLARVEPLPRREPRWSRDQSFEGMRAMLDATQPDYTS